MRVTGRFERNSEINYLVDSLRDMGLTRKDLIISSMVDEDEFKSMKEAASERILIKAETDSIRDYHDFSRTFNEFDETYGILVSVEAPKHKATRIKEAMKDAGVMEIIED